MTKSVDEIFERICTLIEPFNKSNITISMDTTFSVDLELDSLMVMDLLSEIEDEFDITVPLNILPDLETAGQFTQAVQNLLSK
ncbi:MAG: acyl carrier protein [Emcibacter sp.]|nr:acyl carrier protein [Emcibacter sp.]